MKASNNISLRAFGRIAGLVVAAFVWHGCLADGNSLVPEIASADDASTAGRTSTSLEIGANYPEWYVVQSRKIKAGSPSVLKAGRYKLIFDGDEILEDLTITVQEWDPDVIDVDFLPDGLTLLNPAALEIDYKGTANDPDSPDYNGMPHAMYYF